MFHIKVMKIYFVLILLSTVGFNQFANGQQKRVVEPCACPVEIDSSFKTNCGYLVAPENRKKNNGKTIKLPFIVVY
jgi:hypothetical protein